MKVKDLVVGKKYTEAADRELLYEFIGMSKENEPVFKPLNEHTRDRADYIIPEHPYSLSPDGALALAVMTRSV